jgi:hypothetical protein
MIITPLTCSSAKAGQISRMIVLTAVSRHGGQSPGHNVQIAEGGGMLIVLTVALRGGKAAALRSR